MEKLSHMILDEKKNTIIKLEPEIHDANLL